MTKIKTPDEYVNSQPKEYRSMLNSLRDMIRYIIPESEEIISYSIICYQYHYMLVGIGTKKGHCSFYTMNPDMLSLMKEELGGYEYSGSTLYFPLSKPLPGDLIEKIVQERVQENELRAIAQGKI